MTKLSYLLLATLAILCGCGSSPKPGPERKTSPDTLPAQSVSPWTLRTGEKLQILADELNRVVRLVPVRSEEHPHGAYLIQGEGLGSEYQGVVLLAFQEPYPKAYSAEGIAFRVNVHGVPKKVLVRTIKAGWSLWGNGIRLHELAAGNRDMDGAALLALYEEQLASGELEAVAPSTRAGRMAAVSAALAKDASLVTQACGLDVAIDWPSVQDDWFELFDIVSACGRHFRDVELFCRDHPHLMPETKELGTLQCHFEGLPDDTIGRVNKSKDGLVLVPGIHAKNDSASESALVRLELQTLFGEDVEVLRRGEQYFVLRRRDDRTGVYYGTNKELSPQYVLGSGWDYYRNELNLWSAGTNAKLRRQEGKWALECDDKVTPFETIVGKEREDILASAKLMDEPIWKREPHYLGRDSNGVYFYIDKLRKEFGGKHHRVFMGRRGQAKLTTLVGLVEDSQGMLFSTRKGDLRLIVGRSGLGDDATWIRGKKAVPLTTVPLAYNEKLIYQSLGAYFGEPFGDVCVE